MGRPFRALGFCAWLSQGVALGCDRARRWRFGGGGADGFGVWDGMDEVDVMDGD